MRTLLFGGTDLTLALARRVEEHLVGVVTIPPSFEISYAPGGLPSSRFADVGAWARARGIPTQEWSGVDAAIELAAEVDAEWGLAAGWYYLLPGRLLERFPRGVAGLHASLLPRLRGNAPLSWAILTGAEQTGISLFQLTEGLDDGPLHGQATVAIHERATVAELIEATERAGIELVVDALAHPDRPPRAQEGEPTYCLARVPADGAIDWSAPAQEVDRLVRAAGRPYPGASTELDGVRLVIWAAEPDPRVVHGAPGQVWRTPEGEVAVVCGRGALRIAECETADGGDGLPLLRSASMRRLGPSS